MRINKVSIALDYVPFYMPGDQVTGDILIDIDGLLSPDDIKVMIIGEIKAVWRQGNYSALATDTCLTIVQGKNKLIIVKLFIS